MTDAIARLRAADPAASIVGTDERAEAELRLLLAEPRETLAPVSAAVGRRRPTTMLVTVVVAAVLIALTSTVLLFTHPRTDVGGSSTSSCDSRPVAPFSCSPYFSTGGTGSLAFLGTDPFRLGFQHQNGQLTAVLVGRCNALNITLRTAGDTIVGTGVRSTAMLCVGDPGAQDGAVTRFFSAASTYRIDGTGLTFASGSTAATFSTAIGACRAAKAASPFCGESVGTGGSGAVAFLGRQYRLAFMQDGDRIIGLVHALCGTERFDVTVGFSSISLRYVSSSEMRPCPAGADDHDRALRTFLESPLTYRWDGERLGLETASGPYSSATFARQG